MALPGRGVVADLSPASLLFRRWPQLRRLQVQVEGRSVANADLLGSLATRDAEIQELRRQVRGWEVKVCGDAEPHNHLVYMVDGSQAGLCLWYGRFSNAAINQLTPLPSALPLHRLWQLRSLKAAALQQASSGSVPLSATISPVLLATQQVRPLLLSSPPCLAYRHNHPPPISAQTHTTTPLLPPPLCFHLPPSASRAAVGQGEAGRHHPLAAPPPPPCLGRVGQCRVRLISGVDRARVHAGG